MASFFPPILNREFACIVPDDNPVVGAVISSYFNDPGTYFAVFSFPAVDQPYASNFEFSEDGYLSRMIGSETAIFINNAIVKLQPKKIFLAGMTKAQKSYIRAHIPKHMIIEIDVLADVSENLAFLNKQFKGTVECRPSEVCTGLVLSKYTEKQLHIYDKAPSLPKKHISKRRGVIIVENTGESHDISAANFAFSVNADVVIVAPVQKQQIHPLQKLIYEWRSGSSEAYKRLKQTITKRVKGIDFSQYEFATFFSRGLPYGLILNNVIPFSHVLINIDCGLFIFNNIAYETISSSFDNAVVFSPQLVGDEETSDVIAILEKKNYVVRPLVGKKATVKAFNNYAAHFPYDVMHICSHGGETNGFYVVEDFPDRTGKTHRVEYEEVVGFSPESENFQGKDNDQVLVTSKAIFRRFDGFAWGSNEIMRMPSFIFEDMRKVMHTSRRDGVIRVRVKEPIYASCHIACYDSLHQGDFRAVASHGCPVIFNNTCSSWYEIATCFIAAGTRAYIGTLWRVGSTTAKNAAESFYEELFVGGNLLFTFHKMLGCITNKKYRDIYLFWGLHFSTLRAPTQQSDQRAFDDLLASFARWSKRYQTTASPEVRRNCIPILKFISAEIAQNFTPKHFQNLAADIRDQLSAKIEDIPDSDSGLRGVIDL